MKYCSKCDESYSDDNYKYCPICSAKLEEMDEDIFKIERLIGLYSYNRDIFEIDEENKLLKFKWNGRWISESITRIEQHYQTEYHPYQIPCFIEICSSKDDWDNLLKNDLPDYNKKLSYEQARFELFSFKLEKLLDTYEQLIQLRKDAQATLFEILEEIDKNELSAIM